MNTQLIRDYLTAYKSAFGQINQEEIYKWKAIKHFQENFDLEAPDLAANIDHSMQETKNLLASGKYWPLRMLRKNAELAPERVREMLRILFDEDFDLKERIQSFRSDFKTLNREHFGDDNDYQDQRAILVYLVLKYPERYFLYKFGMFEDFAEKVEYPYKPKQGKIENLGHYLSLCELVKGEIQKDQELLGMHSQRLDDTCYRDLDHHVLTQDFIYAVVKHLKEPKHRGSKPLREQIASISYQNIEELPIKIKEPSFKGALINFIQNEIENKRVGDAGELWVVNFEKKHLIENGRPDLAEKIKHSSREEGDGLGYDILSFMNNGSPKYIEVKTTKGSFDSTFYISRNELEWSKRHPEKYYLYRVFNFKDSISPAELTIMKGDLSSLCLMPISYQINFDSTISTTERG